jgi:hypothetical protein
LAVRESGFDFRKGQKMFLFSTATRLDLVTTNCHVQKIPMILGSRDSAVGIATGYWIDDREVGVPVPVLIGKIFVLSTLSR